MGEQNEQPDVRELKRRLSSRLLTEPGVAGVGMHGGRVTVYMAERSDDTEARLKRIVRSLVGDAVNQVAFLFTGMFQAR